MITRLFRSSWWYIALSILGALVLSIMPLPIELKAFRPDWAMLVILYWILALPHRVNIGTAGVVGFLLDILLGTVLGIHALASGLVAYVAATNFQKLRNFSLWQQSLLIMVFMMLYHIVIFWVNRFIIEVNFTLDFVYPAISSGLFWLWVFPVMRAYRRRFRVR